MRRRTYFSLFAVLIWFLPLVSWAQFDDLKAQLEGKEKFSDITATVKQYLETAPESYEKEKLEKRFARWAYYQSMHLGPNNEFVDVASRTFDAVSEKEEIADPSLSFNGFWQFKGPSSSTIDNPGADINGLGRVDRVAFHPTDGSIIYAGTPAGGLWKSDDGGSTWTAKSDFIPSLGISGIVVSHADPNTLYVLTGDGDTYGDGYLVVLAGYHRLSVGVLVSHDDGTTWEETGPLFAGDYVGYRLVQHPTDANILLAATSEGIYRTTNGGTSWVRERTGKHFDIEFKPGDPTRVYASGNGSFVYSTNTGDTWNTNAVFDYALCSGNNRVELAVSPDYANKVYLLAGPKGSGNTFCGMYVSTNSGLNFTRQTNSPNVLGQPNGSGDQSYYDMGLAVSPTNDQIVIAAGLVTWRSTNGGSTFTNATIYRENGTDPYIHPDIHGVEYNPVNGYLYAFGDGGIHRSTDNGVNYTDIYSGLNTTQFYGMDDYDANANAILAGAQDNGVKYKTASGAAFKHIYCCDGADAIINYNDQTKGYAVINSWVLRYSNFTTTSPSFMVQPGFFSEIEMNSSDPDIMYVGYSRIRKYDAGVYQGLLGGSDIKGWWALKTCPSNSNKIYAAGGDAYYDDAGEMFMSTNGGATWTTVSNTTGFPATYNRISDIGVKPNNSPQVWVAFSGYTDGVKVYYSGNSGATSWSDKSYDLPNVPVWSIEVDASNNVYVGTEYGVYYLASGATNWEPFYNGLPNVPVSELAINESSDQLLASTFGRGIWSTTLRDPCPTDRTITVNLQGQNFRTASNSITMTSDVIGGAGTQVWLRSGDYIDLKPGFQADADPGNKFEAYVGACEDGIPPDFSFGNPSDTNNIKTDFNFTLNRNLGTLEIRDISTTQKEVIVRLFGKKSSKVKVFMTNENGTFIKDIAQYEGAEGKSTYTFNTEGLKPGMHFLYLGVNKDVNHLQELYIPGKSDIE